MFFKAMLLKADFVLKTSFAVRTVEFVIVGVFDFVNFQQGFSGECFTAHIANKWFFSGVESHVRRKMMFKLNDVHRDQ